MGPCGRYVDFWGEGKTGVPGEKPLGAGKRTNKLGPHETPDRRIEPGPQIDIKKRVRTHCVILFTEVFKNVLRLSELREEKQLYLLLNTCY